jgi:hypothetical protein
MQQKTAMPKTFFFSLLFTVLFEMAESSSFSSSSPFFFKDI